jgi:microcin C transport system substrate-binding protein
MRLVTAFLVALAIAAPATAQTTRTHAIAEFGAPALGPDFPHLPHVNPSAPKGGTLTLSEPGTFSVQGTFDTLNLLPLRGVPARSVALLHQSLFVASGDEQSVSYGLIAATAEYPEDRSWIAFDIRPEARWNDGTPITADDVVWTFEMVKAHGNPFLKSFYAEIEGATVEGPRRVRFSVTTRDSMKPLANIAGLTVYPKHWWTSNGRDIGRGTLEPPLGSGPYRLAQVEPGRTLVYERVRDHWSERLPIAVGQANFDTIRIVYFRDEDVRYEAFFAGNYDVRSENRAQRWVQGYDAPAVREGRIKRLELADARPKGAQGFRFNTRRERFADPRVREAFAHLFDFQWIQRTILYGQYARTVSNFPNSDFGASGPPTPEELALLEPFRATLDPRVFTEAYAPPSGDGTGSARTGLREALRLFRAAGWEVRNNRLVNTRTGEPMTVEFLEDDPSLQRIIQPYVETLRRAGIDASLRIVDAAQMQARTDDFDFDAQMVNFNFFPPPGPELRSYFGSAAAATQGSANYAGIRDRAVDALIETVIAAPDLASLKVANRALDRALLWGWYMVPQWYSDTAWIAHWDRFGRPERTPRYAVGVLPAYVLTWWSTAR